MGNTCSVVIDSQASKATVLLEVFIGYKWPYKRVTGVITMLLLVGTPSSGVIILLTNGRDQPFRLLELLKVSSSNLLF